MSLVYNQDERMLVDTAQSFFAEQSPVSAMRAQRDHPSLLGFDPSINQQIVEMGWNAICFDETYGGLAFGHKGMGGIFEAMGQHLTASPLLSSVVLCGTVLQHFARSNQLSTDQCQLLEDIISGDKRVALALDEQARHQGSQVGLTASSVKDGYQLVGDKVLVMDAHGADALIVAAKIDDDTEMSLFLVPADAGFTHQNLSLIDSRQYSRIGFDGVKVDADSLLGKAGTGQAALEPALDLGRLCLASEMLGACHSLFAMTLEYLKTREQFDAKIGSFQALQHRAAQCFVELELARSTVISGFDLADAISPHQDDTLQQGASQQQSVEQQAAVKAFAMAASLAKWKVGTMADMLTREAIQMHGGIGVTDELDVGLYLKRIRVAQMCLGDGDFHLARFGELSD